MRVSRSVRVVQRDGLGGRILWNAPWYRAVVSTSWRRRLRALLALLKYNYSCFELKFWSEFCVWLNTRKTFFLTLSLSICLFSFRKPLSKNYIGKMKTTHKKSRLLSDPLWSCDPSIENHDLYFDRRVWVFVCCCLFIWPVMMMVGACKG